ncbi:hypothetical protein Bca52824_046069 [Brassica carinata]|uniref:Uncharacterized protein n=1 Tax=Brassica carinata TaxID=52824 RepID=A0A8X7RGH7_BRACI|nr:hypothetical protein Bca52824_046069 [Brassica carinata]
MDLLLSSSSDHLLGAPRIVVPGNESTDSEKKEQVEETEKQDTSYSSKENGNTEEKQSEDASETSQTESDNKNGEIEEVVNQNDQEHSDASSDNSLPQEMKDVRTDLETLPDSGNGGGNSDNVAAE